MKELSEISGSLEIDSKEDIKPGVYRSRLFGFIHRQAYRLREGVGLGLRQVKVSVQWTGQILLSPLRWFDRFKQDASRQIAGKEKLKQLPPTPTKPRIEVESLLAEVAAAGYGELQMPAREDWSVVDAKDWDTTLLGGSQLALRGESAPVQRTKPVIRGLASLLADRSLVLVDRYNQILDVLSPSQQFHLQRQIDPALAKQWSIDRANATENPDLAAASDSLSLNAADHQSALPPAPPNTPWQKLGYWLHFYREYLWIDSPKPDAGGQITLSPPGAVVMPTREFVQPISPAGSLARPVAAGESSATKAVDTQLVSKIVASGSSRVDKSKRTLNDRVAAKDALRSKEWEVEGGRNIVPQQTHHKTVFTPEWIETPTSDLGYHRSIFVRLMEWLDRLMLTLENWLILIFQRFFQKDN
jgi:hypothetical protein